MLWSPSPERIAQSQIAQFARSVGQSSDYFPLHKWSVAHPEAFWTAASEFLRVHWRERGGAAKHILPTQGMRGAQWFTGWTLNFAENLLFTNGAADQDIALIAFREGATELERREVSFASLRNAVQRLAATLKQQGVGPGDRVAGIVANGPEAIVAMAATAALGGVWASCSPDFGEAAIADRLQQIQPKVVFYTTSYRYAGKFFPSEVAALNVIEKLRAKAPVRAVPVESVTHLLEGGSGELLSVDDFAAMPFQAPLYILFSSGTTGVPKCIVHSVGGTLLQHKKELMLHGDLKAGDRLLYFTTCGWMMWNWMVSALACRVSLVLFDGSPAWPNLQALWQIVDRERVTAFGTSPKFISSCAEITPRETFALAGLRTIFSTGAPLLPEHFVWVYERVKKDVHLASISGGTDIVSCFMLGVPTLPVYAGEIQAPGLGMAVEAWNEEGTRVFGLRGELVCTKPFPSMPIGFWNDPDGEKYRKAYFAFSFPEAKHEVWRHGDFVAESSHGGFTVYGRSDATLNPGGVRIGTAEIYRVVETIGEIADSIAVGQRWQDDTRIVLFVKVKPGIRFDEALVGRIRAHIRTLLSPRHVPAMIKEVRDIPYTRSGKKVELAVTQLIHGEAVLNLNAIANPEALKDYVLESDRSNTTSP